MIFDGGDQEKQLPISFSVYLVLTENKKIMIDAGHGGNNPGASYEGRRESDDALRLAQELGFAESNPTLDIDGWDSLFKLIIVTMHAFGVYVAPEEIWHFDHE